MRKKILLTTGLFFIIAGLITSSQYFQHKGSSGSSLPDYATRNMDVRTAYQYAIEKPDLLSYVPCYCNCYKLGHGSVEDCFVKEFKEDGNIVFEEHGAVCGICSSTVLDAKYLAQQNKTAKEIRTFVDNKYSQYGRATNTPQP